MADIRLPLEDAARPLRWLFLDLNAYFASCEQQERPELRDRPVAVAPVDAETTFVIAASYEAKAYGVKCGTMVAEARRMCPGLEVVQARPTVYTAYHRRIVEVASTVLPLDKVCSIDEMRFTLLGAERSPVRATELAREMKRAVREGVGERMTCSVGVAPNHFLAKVATDMRKPDGLTVLTADDLPDRLHELALTDIAGINRATAARLAGAGIFTVAALCRASREELRSAFRSVIGERWWYLLRGFDIPPEEHERKTLGHSHVLAPPMRTDRGCRETLLRLIQKAGARLRSLDLVAEGLSVRVGGFERSWHDRRRIAGTSDTLALNAAFEEMWTARDFASPRLVGVTLDDLRAPTQTTPSLFDTAPERGKLMGALDELNGRFGRNAVFLAGMERTRHSAEERIAFAKTELFDGGPIADTFRGLTTV